MQHHHAHLAACLAEHGETGPAVGAIYDGTGLGTDGTAWGGEILVGDLRSFGRAGHLCPCALPGGDRAAREPWRMACAWLVAAGDRRAEVPATLRDAVAEDRWRCRGRGWPRPASRRRSRRAWAGSSTPSPRSAGCGPSSTYEGQAAIELEAVADRRPRRSCLRAGAPTSTRGGLVRAVLEDVRAGVGAAVVSARFHRGARARHRGRLRRARRRTPGSTSSSSRAASSRTGCC